MFKSGQKRGVHGQIKKELRRRSAIEAVIGHCKTDGHLDRIFLHGRDGDQINAVMSAVGYAIAVPVVSSLPALVLHPENRGPGFGIFQVWYFAGSALMPIAAGYLQDLTGGATASLLFATGMMFAVLCLHGVFRFEQRRLAAD